MKTRLVLAILAFGGIATSVACSSSDNSNGGEDRTDGGTDSGSSGDWDSGNDPGEDSGTGGEGAFDPVFEILSKNCTGCHAGSAPSGKLALTPKDTAYANLVDVRAEGPACGSFDGGSGLAPWRVRSGSPAKSLLLDKLQSATPECGARMPKTSTAKPRQPLPQEDIDTIHQWIAGGAHK